MIDFPGQALHPRVLILVSLTWAAVAWLLPCGAFQGFMAVPPLNPQLTCVALQLRLFLGMPSPCVSMVFCIRSNAWFWVWTFPLTASRAGRLRSCLEPISFPCLVLACPFFSTATRFSRSAGSQQMFAEMAADPACTAVIQHLLRSECSLMLCQHRRESFTYPIG